MSLTFKIYNGINMNHCTSMNFVLKFHVNCVPLHLCKHQNTAKYLIYSKKKNLLFFVGKYFTQNFITCRKQHNRLSFWPHEEENSCLPSYINKQLAIV